MRGRKRTFIENRQIIEGELESFHELVSYTKGYAKIRDIANERLVKEQRKPVSQDAVYRAIVKKQLPSEYMAYITLDACKKFVNEINQKTQKILSNFDI